MAEMQVQQKEQVIRSGYFDREAFAQKKRWILVLKTAIAGLQFYVDDNSEEGRKLLDSLVPGTQLHLFRDPDNEHDCWAISVYTTDDRELGHVTRFKNETIARLMDEGKVFHAVVDEPPETRSQDQQPGFRQTPTENFKLPFSIYMED